MWYVNAGGVSETIQTDISFILTMWYVNYILIFGSPSTVPVLY